MSAEAFFASCHSRRKPRAFLVALGLLACLGFGAVPAQDSKIDPATGLTIAPHWETVRNNCIACHSADLITQQHKSREGWQEVIEWMQETQGLREFKPETERIILDYLAEHYGPKQGGIRAWPLDPSLMPPNPYTPASDDVD